MTYESDIEQRVLVCSAIARMGTQENSMILQGLGIVRQYSHKGRAIERVVEDGKYLWEAMGQAGYTQEVTDAVKAGEMSGTLGEALARAVTLLKKEHTDFLGEQADAFSLIADRLRSNARIEDAVAGVLGKYKSGEYKHPRLQSAFSRVGDALEREKYFSHALSEQRDVFDSDMITQVDVAEKLDRIVKAGHQGILIGALYHISTMKRYAALKPIEIPGIIPAEKGPEKA